MHDWQHVVARWILAGAVFLLACGKSALLSELVWRARHWLSPASLKGLLTLLVLLPPGAALLVTLLPSFPSCSHNVTCYVGWLQHALGERFLAWMRPLSLMVVSVLLLLLARLVYRAVGTVRTLRWLFALSGPPSPKLRDVLVQVVPAQWRARFWEVEMPVGADGVYGGICLLSRETVQSLDTAQVQAVVAHEYQHLRARDGWFALGMGLLAGSLGLGLWGVAYRHWNSAAELLADARATQQGIARTALAQTLLSRQAQAQGLLLGFSADGALLEERLRYLLSPVCVCRGAEMLWALILACAGGLLYMLWQTGSASTCTIHCVLF
ncbi:MAG: hypothetical protein ACUVR7_10650 [Armatimonadota bacterium]